MYSFAYARKNSLIRNPTLTQRKGNFKTDLSTILKPHLCKRQNFIPNIYYVKISGQNNNTDTCYAYSYKAVSKNSCITFPASKFLFIR